MDEIKEEDERYFIVVGLFEGDELSAVRLSPHVGALKANAGKTAKRA